MKRCWFLPILIQFSTMPIWAITWTFQCTDPNNPQSGRWVWKLDKPDELVPMPEYMYFYAPPQYILIQIPAASASRMTPTKFYIAQSHTTITDSMGFLRELADKWTTVYDMTELSWLSAHWIPHSPPEQPSVDEPNEPIEQPVTIPLVYVTPFVKKYHLPTCYYAAGSGIAIPITEAWTAGLEPCKVCKPDEYFLQENEL